jgi:hypothetical protein
LFLFNSFIPVFNYYQINKYNAMEEMIFCWLFLAIYPSILTFYHYLYNKKINYKPKFNLIVNMKS